MAGQSARALRRQGLRLKVVRVAKQLNHWLVTDEQFSRFEVTGELFPRGTSRAWHGLSFLVENTGRFFTKKLCTSVVKELLSENGYRPVRQMGESLHAYCVRQACVMQKIAKRMKMSARVEKCVEKTKWKKSGAWSVWDQSWEEDEDWGEWGGMDVLDTVPMQAEVARASALICIPISLLPYNL